MYGQYRTGDYLVPYFIEFFKNKYNVQVDFFCSSKETRNYLNSPHERNNNTDNVQQVWNKKDLTEKLQNSNLQPKAVNVISQEEEEVFLSEDDIDLLSNRVDPYYFPEEGDFI